MYNLGKEGVIEAVPREEGAETEEDIRIKREQSMLMELKKVFNRLNNTFRKSCECHERKMSSKKLQMEVRVNTSDTHSIFSEYSECST